ncbi:MAG: sulfite exporter TauE/SafE family protein, partial [Rhodospirillaceae bacterium]|nr:sulfite exporter TauE/SafE family protein [Rhodospirillaceae bacterium]
ISPIQAAGIMLPIMIPMDFLSIWMYRKLWDGKNLALLIPAATVGITIGGLTAGYVNDQIVRLLVGIIAVVFTIHRASGLYLRRRAKGSKEDLRKSPNRVWGAFWGTCAGFTSFLAHAGSPPYQVYVIPQGLSKEIYAGTSVMFFAAANAIKLIPYGMLGQLSVTNLSVSAALLPLVPVGVFLGVWINRRLPEKTFFAIILASIFLVGVKLIWDGVFNLVGV